MTLLAEFRPLVGHLPHQPLNDVVLFLCLLGKEAAFLLSCVHHDSGRFENCDRRSAALGLAVNESRHAIIRREFQKCRVELIASTDVDGFDRIGRPKLFQKDRYLLAVRSGPVKDLKHSRSSRELVLSEPITARGPMARWKQTCANANVPSPAEKARAGPLPEGRRRPDRRTRCWLHRPVPQELQLPNRPCRRQSRRTCRKSCRPFRARFPGHRPQSWKRWRPL